MRYLLFILALTNFGCFANTIDMEDAIEIAEKFIKENGYTNATKASFANPLVLESIERTSDRDALLKQRFNSLKSKALGAKKNHESWLVAFDYAEFEAKKLCRVVVLNLDGSEPYIEHQSGYRSYFLSKE